MHTEKSQCLTFEKIRSILYIREKIMSYYELRADQKKYFQFYHHYTPNAIAHFHSAVEMLIIQNGEIKYLETFLCPIRYTL